MIASDGKLFDFEKFESVEMIFGSMMMKDGYKQNIYKNMKTYGGSFVQSLAECIMTADSNNLRKLIDTFHDYFVEYLPEKWA